MVHSVCFINGYVTVPISQMKKKMRYREVNEFGQDHTANNWQNKDSKHRSLALD